jgi:hypothetical protein
LASLIGIAQTPVLLLFTLLKRRRTQSFLFGFYWVFYGRLDVKKGHNDSKKCLMDKTNKISRTKIKHKKSRHVTCVVSEINNSFVNIYY